ncbi:MAG: TraR/DksA family transcriptional regulator [Aeromicrobium sp.]
MSPDSRAAAHLDAEQSLTLERLAVFDADFALMVAASADSNADDEHDPEGATIAFERSQLDSLISQARRHLDDIERARVRLANGTYGFCETCGNPIGEARLEARPVARTCINCAQLP